MQYTLNTYSASYIKALYIVYCTVLFVESSPVSYDIWCNISLMVYPLPNLCPSGEQTSNIYSACLYNICAYCYNFPYIFLTHCPGMYSFFIVRVHSICVYSTQRHTKRQATQHGCLPSLLFDEDKENDKVYGEKKNIFFIGPTRAAKAEQKSLVPARQAQQTNQPLSLVLFESPFISVSKSAGAIPLYCSLRSRRRRIIRVISHRRDQQ